MAEMGLVQTRVTLSDAMPEAIRAECFGADDVTAGIVTGVHWRECYLAPHNLNQAQKWQFLGDYSKVTGRIE
jgi:hypothetical protein